MNPRVGSLVALGLLAVVVALLIGRVAMINRLGGVPGAAEAEPWLHRLESQPVDPDASRALQGLGNGACQTITNYLGFRESRIRRGLREWVGARKWLRWRIYDESDYQRMAELGARCLENRIGPHLIRLFSGAPLDQAGDTPARRADLLLARLGASMVPALRDGLQSPEGLVRGHCALAVAHHSELQVAGLAPNLAALARDPDTQVRAAVMLALGRLLEGADSGVPALMVGLSDESGVVRFHAAHSLWAMGALARPALPAFSGAIARESSRRDEGMDEWLLLGPKSREAILYAMTNAWQTIREHGD